MKVHQVTARAFRLEQIAPQRVLQAANPRFEGLDLPSQSKTLPHPDLSQLFLHFRTHLVSLSSTISLRSHSTPIVRLPGKTRLVVSLQDFVAAPPTLSFRHERRR